MVALSFSSLSCKHGYPKYISLWLFWHSLCLGVGLQLMFQHPSGNHADQSLSCLQKKNASDKQQLQDWGQEAFGAKRLCLEMAGRGEHGAGKNDHQIIQLGWITVAEVWGDRASWSLQSVGQWGMFFTVQPHFPASHPSKVWAFVLVLSPPVFQEND